MTRRSKAWKRSIRFQQLDCFVDCLIRGLNRAVRIGAPTAQLAFLPHWSCCQVPHPRLFLLGHDGLVQTGPENSRVHESKDGLQGGLQRSCSHRHLCVSVLNWRTQDRSMQCYRRRDMCQITRSRFTVAELSLALLSAFASCAGYPSLPNASTRRGRSRCSQLL